MRASSCLVILGWTVMSALASSEQWSNEGGMNMANVAGGTGGGGAGAGAGTGGGMGTGGMTSIEALCGSRRYGLNQWVFGTYSRNYPPYSVVNSDGDLIGFDIDLVHHVCKIAGQTCHVSLVPQAHCQAPVGSRWALGLALITGQLDGCLDVWPTTFRLPSADFTRPYRFPLNSYFYKRPGDLTFDPTNIAGKIIVEVSHWGSRLSCITANGLSGFTSLSVNTQEEAINAVNNGIADAFWSYPWSGMGGLEQVGAGWKCVDGTTLATVTGSCVPAWWDRAYAKFVACGCYAKLCEKTETTFGIKPRCFSYSGGSCTDAERAMYCP